MKKFYLLAIVTLAFVACGQKKSNEENSSELGFKGNPISYTQTVWEAKEVSGKVVKGEIKEISETYYNLEGNTTGYARYNPDGTLKNKSTYEYNENGKLLSKRVYDANGNITESCTRTYLTDKEYKEEVFYKNPVEEYTEETIYYLASANGSDCDSVYTTRSYTNGEKRTTKRIYEIIDENTKKTYTYDSKWGNEEEINCDEIKGSTRIWKTINAKTNEVTSETHFKNGERVKDVWQKWGMVSEYEHSDFDEKGNWTTEVTFQTGKDGLRKAILIVTREFQYE